MSDRRIILFLDLWPSPAESARPILSARRLGLEILLIAKHATAAQIDAVDYFIAVDTYRSDLVGNAFSTFAHKDRIVGVAKWLDRSVEIAAMLSTDLNLPTMSIENATVVRNKFLSKKAAQSVGVRTPRNASILHESDISDAADKVGFPAIFKPVSASASRYIFKVNSKRELKAAVHQLIRWTEQVSDPILTISRGFILEEFVEGRLITIDGIAGIDAICFAGIIDHQNTQDTFLDWQHIFPAPLDNRQIDHCLEAARKILKATGVKHTPFQIEGMLTESGFVFIEMAARTAGDYNSTHLIPSVLQIDYLADCIRAFIGEEPNDGRSYTVPNNFYAGTRYKIVDATGIFQSLEGVGAASRLHGYEHIFVEVEEGQAILQPPADYFSSRVASLFASSSTYENVQSVLKAMDEAVAVRFS